MDRLIRLSGSAYREALLALPLCGPADVIGTRRLLVVAPHPDDESLGCGGLLAWAAAQGREPHIVFLTDGEASHQGSPTYPAARIAQRRRREAGSAAAELGLSARQLHFLQLPDSQLAQLSAQAFGWLMAWFDAWIAAQGPTVLCATAATDPHGDHRAAHAFALQAAAQARDCTVFSYPVWSWTLDDAAQVPAPRGRRIDIAAHLPAKRRAVRAHASQHGGVITDAVQAFQLPPSLLDQLDRPFEVLLDEVGGP